MALSIPQQLFQAVFEGEQSVVDFVQSIDAHKRDEATFISTRCLPKIREHVQRREMDVKARAILKLIYVRSFSCF
jgi:hypothetical protein